MKRAISEVQLIISLSSMIIIIIFKLNGLVPMFVCKTDMIPEETIWCSEAKDELAVNSSVACKMVKGERSTRLTSITLRESILFCIYSQWI